MLKRSTRKLLPEAGAVGGIDVGWSQKRATSAVARLEWDRTSATIAIERYRAVEPERSLAIARILDRPLLAVALDGPLCTGLVGGRSYRYAERLLTSGFQPKIGKPGQTSSLNGQKLNMEATRCAKLLAGAQLVAGADHPEKIHHLAIVEAFPTSFLGVMLPVAEGLKSKKRASSDIFFEKLSEEGILEKLIRRLLPDLDLSFEIGDIRNHDDRAAFVCALTSLCIAAGEYTAVGDHDGWIVLPPFDFVQPWAHAIFENNLTNLERSGIRPLVATKLGLASGMYRSMSLEEFNASDDEIARSFLDGPIEPEIR